MKLSFAVMISLSKEVKIDAVGAGCGDCSIANAPSPIFVVVPSSPLTVSVCKAVTRYYRKCVGSLSPSSKESQPADRSQPETHSLTSVVLPKPAGAVIRVSLRPSCRPLVKAVDQLRTGHQVRL